jgi:sortase A
MKKNLSTIILILVFLTGLSLLLYPTVSDYWNSLHQSRAIAGYSDAVAKIDSLDYEKIWKDAQDYNRKLLTKRNRYFLTDEEREEYNSILNVAGNGIIGYIEIPAIKSSLAIYHGIEESILQIAVGHIEGTSLPVGGEGTHSVISAHRGLPSAKLFTDLDQLIEGDIFMIQVLKQTLTYEVDQILIVEPHEIEALAIEEDKDYFTLVTCTPYGINTHRLLVRGHRVENIDSDYSSRIVSEALQIDRLIVAVALAVPILILLSIWVIIYSRRRRG